jgi:hypothetical protein
MTIGVRCGSCNRELLLVQLAQPSQGFRCLFCAFAFAPGYATVAPGVAARGHGRPRDPGHRAHRACVDDR